jgi:hypothetical protein
MFKCTTCGSSILGRSYKKHKTSIKHTTYDKVAKRHATLSDVSDVGDIDDLHDINDDPDIDIALVQPIDVLSTSSSSNLTSTLLAAHDDLTQVSSNLYSLYYLLS